MAAYSCNNFTWDILIPSCWEASCLGSPPPFLPIPLPGTKLFWICHFLYITWQSLGSNDVRVLWIWCLCVWCSMVVQWWLHCISDDQGSRLHVYVPCDGVVLPPETVTISLLGPSVRNLTSGTTETQCVPDLRLLLVHHFGQNIC